MANDDVMSDDASPVEECVLQHVENAVDEYGFMFDYVEEHERSDFSYLMYEHAEWPYLVNIGIDHKKQTYFYAAKFLTNKTVHDYENKSLQAVLDDLDNHMNPFPPIEAAVLASNKHGLCLVNDDRLEDDDAYLLVYETPDAQIIKFGMDLEDYFYRCEETGFTYKSQSPEELVNHLNWHLDH